MNVSLSQCFATIVKAKHYGARTAPVEPLFPIPRRRKRYPGRKRLDNRRVLTGFLFVLQSGIPREMLPQEMGCGSGMTCWRRLRAWHKAGVWKRLHQVLLAELRGADQNAQKQTG